MSVTGIGASTGSNPYSLSTSAATNPYAAIVQQQQADVTSLFGSADSQLSALTPTAAAYSLYQNPALLEGLTKWDGSQTPGSERTADPATVQGNTDGVQPDFSFNPFDQSTWDVASPAVQSSAAGATDGSSPFTFNPFDQSSWDSQYPAGSFVNTLA